MLFVARHGRFDPEPVPSQPAFDDSQGLALKFIGTSGLRVLRHPATFARSTLKAFRANQGLLLAGAVAYYALLSIVPLLIISVIALSHFIDQAELLQTLQRYLGWLMPGQSDAIIAELANFILISPQAQPHE